MRLDCLELRNICQLGHLKWEFGRGLIGICGPNGSGKSNAMNVAAYAGLTNDYSRHTKGKPGMIRQQASKDEKAQIRVAFSHEGSKFEIIRGLQHPVRHVMKRPGKPDLKKVNDIQAELEDVLGIKRRLIDDYVFVDQYSLFAFLSAVPSERAKSFAYLCDTIKAERIWELLKDQAAADAGLVADLTDDLDSLRAQSGEYKERLRSTEQELAEKRELLLSEEELQEAEVVVAARNEADRLKRQVEELEQEELRKRKAAKAARASQKEARVAVDEAEQESEGDEEALEEVVAALATLKEARLANERRETLEQRKVGCEEELGRRTKEAEKCVDPGFDKEELATKREELKWQLLQNKQLLDNFAAGVEVCPTCGTPTDSPDLEERLTLAREQQPELKESIKSLEADLRAQKAYESERSTLDDVVGRLTQQLEDLEEDLASLGEAMPVDEDTERQHKALSREIKHRRDRNKQLREAATKADSAFERKRAEHVTAKKAIEKCQAELEQVIAVSEEQFLEHRDALAKHAITREETIRLKAEAGQLKDFVNKTAESIARVLKAQRRSARAKIWLKMLQEVRDDVMHRDKLPKVVHRNYLLNMEDEINETLDLFDSPFRVTATDDIGFTAKFTNNTRMPAAGLSGGQKVMLAMAYRLTVNSLFASQVGMMVLDEPTDGLDQENRDLAAQVFVQLGEVARSRGHQVIVITHDEALRSAFDQRLVLERVD